MIQHSQPAIFDTLGKINWAYEEFDISNEIILQFILKLPDVNLNLHVLSNSELENETAKQIASLKPYDKDKLLSAIKWHTVAQKKCDLELNILRKHLRKIVCLSGDLLQKMKISKNFIYAGRVLTSTRLLERFVTWHNKYIQHQNVTYMQEVLKRVFNYINIEEIHNITVLGAE